MKKLIIYPLFIALLFSCEEEEGPEQIHVSVGEQFVIELQANWSTGYSWAWENQQEISVADTIDRVYIQSDPGLGGGAGVEEWTFTGKMEGKETIQFIYRKGSDANSAPLEIREYSVDVTAS